MRIYGIGSSKAGAAPSPVSAGAESQAASAGRTGRSRAWWQALISATNAVRRTDPTRLDSALQELAGRRRWLAPLAYAAGAVAVVFEGILVLLRDWRLTLLQVFPAAWIWAMTWNLRNHFLSRPDITVTFSIVAAVIVVVAAVIAYWCNATFAFTMVQDGGKAEIKQAFRAARARWRLVSGMALATGGLQAVIWLLVPHVEARWLWLALLLMFIVQVYLFIAVPCWLLSVRKSGTRRDRTLQSLSTSVLSGVVATPGFLFNRIGLLLLGIGPLWVVGLVAVSVGAVLHVTASSSVRVVKLSLKLKPSESSSIAEPGRQDVRTRA
jgi:hypothetical protein